VQELPGDPDGGDDEALLSSIDDVRAAIDALTEAEWGKLLRVARWFARRCGEADQDLLQEGVARAWAGKRRCRKGVPITAFIAGIMKSLASQETEAKKAGTRPWLRGDFDDEVRPEWVGEQVSPEHAVVSRMDAAPHSPRSRSSLLTASSYSY
jgi:DNA-directed RNA polymerase specialized sigma24 family protein